MADLETLEVTIKNIVFQTGEGTFSVFRAVNKELGVVTCVYRGKAPYAGEQVSLTGAVSADSSR